MPSQVQWLTPAPLWGELAANADKDPFRRPALLRFATDTFMEDLQKLLAKTPEKLADYIAQPETWRSPAAGLHATIGPPPEGDDPAIMKLFQPSQARFYLLSASLVCRQFGLPDHKVQANQGETTTFVVRRLQLKSNAAKPAGSPFDPQTYDEYAWIPDASAPGWMQVSNAGVLVAGEEQLPLFSFQFGSNGSTRRMFAGMIPTGKRQTYVSGRALIAQLGGQPALAISDDPRKIEFQRVAIDPWADLLDWYGRENPKDLVPVPSMSEADQLAAARGSALILIDFDNYLKQYLKPVWDAVHNSANASNLHGAALDLYNSFAVTLGNPFDASRYTLSQAMSLAKQFEPAFESEVLVPGQHPTLPSGYQGSLLTDSNSQLRDLIGRTDDPSPTPPRPIQVLVEAALDQAGPAPPSAVPPPAKDPQNPQGDDWFVVRSVYQRPQCGVKTLPATPLISPPSLPFQLASFFDPHAPARPVQVALPIDTSPAALRKYNKNVAFLISDQLGQQMKRVTGLKDLMDGKLGNPGGLGLGMICSLSIPIITICAFLVLMIFLILLNIVFFWLPFFKICFPVPTLKAKG